MNREIKFRAWDKQNNKFIDKIDLRFTGINIAFELTQLIWMQYIGMKDKNGKEIYEGDIVRFVAKYCAMGFNSEKTGVIKWDYVCWKIISGNYNYSIYDETDEFYHKSEVIGNIFENPELIEGVKK